MTDSDELRRRNKDLNILNTIAAALNNEADLAKVLATVLETLTQVTPVESGWVWLLHDDTGKPYLAASYQLPPALADHPRRMYGTCYCLDEFDEDRLDKTEHYSNIICTRLKNLQEGTRGLLYHASAPLMRGGRKLGVLNLTFQDQQPWTTEQLRLVNTIADMLSVAIERAQLFEQSVALGALEERNRIAREIHDTIAQGLTGIALQLETADALLDAGARTEKIQQIIDKTLKLTRAHMEEARRSVLDLRAAPLEGQSLVGALGVLVAKQGGALRTKFDAVGETQPLSTRVEVGLYRIAQEAITNVTKHANANHLAVTLVITPDEVKLTVHDDGVGAAAPIQRDGHFGLIGMNERAKLLGGALTICKNEAGGTDVCVIVPLDQGVSDRD